MGIFTWRVLLGFFWIFDKKKMFFTFSLQTKSPKATEEMDIKLCEQQMERQKSVPFSFPHSLPQAVAPGPICPWSPLLLRCLSSVFNTCLKQLWEKRYWVKGLSPVDSLPRPSQFGDVKPVKLSPGLGLCQTVPVPKATLELLDWSRG